MKRNRGSIEILVASLLMLVFAQIAGVVFWFMLQRQRSMKEAHRVEQSLHDLHESNARGEHRLKLPFHRPFHRSFHREKGSEPRDHEIYLNFQ